MYKYLILVIFIFALSMESMAQHTVSGIVSDQKDKTKFLDNVAVYIPDFNRYDISKEGGTYILRNVGIGVVNIQFTRVGYKSVVRTINTKDSATVLNIEMEPSSMELEEVAITSNSTKLPDDIPYPVITYSADELKRDGNMGLLQRLSYEQGIDKISLGNGITKPVIRGLSFNRLLLYQYGTRIDNQPWDDRHDMGINENGVDKVEVIKGPAALIYGADAMGGTIIFTDEKPAISGNVVGDVNLGFHTNTLGIVSEAGVKGTSAKGLFYSVRLGANSHTSYVQGEGEEVKKNTEDKEFAANSKFMSTNGKFVLGMSKKWGVSKLTYSYLNQQIGIIEIENDSTLEPGDLNAEQRDREMEAPYQDVTSHIAALENTVVLGSSKINFNLSYQLNDRKEFEPLPDKQKEDAIALKLSSITYDLKYSSNSEKKFGYTIGTQGLIQSNKNSGKEGLVPDADESDLGFYALIRYDVKKWNFLAGGRFDARNLSVKSYESSEVSVSPDERPFLKFDRNFSLANGSIGTAYHPIERLTLKANVSTGFTAPNYAQLGVYGKHEGTYRFEAGNKNLDIEQNLEGDFAAILNSKNVDIHLEGFYNKITGYIYLKNNGGFKTVSIAGVDSLLPFYEYRQDDATISGAEFALDIHPEQAQWIDLNLSYGIMKAELEDGGNLPYIPADKFVASLKFKKNKMNYVYNPYLQLVYSKYFELEEVATFETKSEGYELLDLHLGGSFRWGHEMFDLSISANNLMNTGYFNHLSLVRTIGVRDMGRNVCVNLKIPFGIKRPK